MFDIYFYEDRLYIFSQKQMFRSRTVYNVGLKNSNTIPLLQEPEHIRALLLPLIRFSYQIFLSDRTIVD